MLTVFKYTVPIDDYFTLELPEGAQVLTVQGQRNSLQLWALVNPDHSLRKRTFRFAGTGHPIKESPDKLRWVSTLQMANGGLVFHIFEILE